MRLPGSVRRGAHLASAVGRAAVRAARHEAFPRMDGEMAVDGVDSAIEVIRDRWGVPHIVASTAADAFFGHGFVHAQDRLFQMEGARRLAAGRLAEVVGPGALDSDRLMRRVGLARAAERDAADIGGAERALMAAYARGVNAGVASLDALPPEFPLIGDRFEPWSIADSMLVGRFVMFGFGGNWVTELLRERLAHAVGSRRAADLDPVHPPGSTVTGYAYSRAASDLLAAYEAALDAGLPGSLASNAWAVDGTRTRSGRPLLASDPHVEVALPGLFHVAHLGGGDVDVIGAGIPGIPGVAIGHGAEIAWGITAGMADVADCYLEAFDPASPGGRRYRTDTGWADADQVIERIEVAGGETVDERVLITRHGPVVSPAIGDSRAIALYSSVVAGREPASSFIGLSRARSLDEAEAALDHWSGTSFNFILADTSGAIGYRFAGEVPRRASGVGLLPQNGATSTGPPPFLPPESLPRLRAPASGAVVSANNAPGWTASDAYDLGPELAPDLGEEWCEPRRWERIHALLLATPQHDVDSFRAVQCDRYSANLVALRDLIAEHTLLPEEHRPRVAPLFEGWDGQVTADGAAAVLMHVTARMLTADLVERLAGPSAPLALGAVDRPLPANSAFAYRSQGMIVQATLDAAAPWFTDASDRDRTLTGIVRRAVEFLDRECGTRPQDWGLGDLQRIEFRHALHDVPGLGAWWSRGSHPFGGDVNTIVQAQGAAWGERVSVGVAPGYRQILDLADWDASVFMHPTGNSGIPGHPRYGDSIDEYLADAYRPLVFTDRAVRAAAEATLVLTPAGGGAP